MNELTTRPGPVHDRRREDPRADPPTTSLDALLAWKSLERCLNDRNTSDEHGPCTLFAPRSEQDGAYLELMFEATGRDVYRFSAW